jgi:hypothetical protein
MYIFRTKETHDLYEEEKKGRDLAECPLCKAEPIVDFTFWKIIHNKFPYDAVSQVHHMIIPKRHIVEHELTDAEKKELLQVKHSYINDNYTFMLEAMMQHKSIPEHLHIHLIIPKEDL